MTIRVLYRCMRQLKHTTNFLVNEIVFSVALEQNGQHKQKMIKSLGLSSSAKKSNAQKKNGKNSFEMMNIVISLTTNFIAAFHGLYLLAVHYHSFQSFFFWFWVEQVENGLRTMSNKMCYPTEKKAIS